ncbi:MAG: HEAT repeat domain-containing protein [Candidatus Omnitrophota bacterium]
MLKKIFIFTIPVFIYILVLSALNKDTLQRRVDKLITEIPVNYLISTGGATGLYESTFNKICSMGGKAVPSLLARIKLAGQKEPSIESLGFMVSAETYCLRRIGKPAVPYLIRAFEDRAMPDSAQWLLVDLMKETEDKRVLPPFIKALFDKNEDIRIKERIVFNLGSFHDRQAAAALIKVLDEDDYVLRIRAITALKEIGYKDALPPVLPAVKAVINRSGSGKDDKARTFPFSLGKPSVCIFGDPDNRHNFQPVHDSNIIAVNKIIDGARRAYLAYDCDFRGALIRLYYSDDLEGPWLAYSGNPVLGPSDRRYRWPSVVYDGSIFHMFLTNIADKQIERWTSTDGINYAYREKMNLENATIYMNPFCWKNPNDGNWYLYRQRWAEKGKRQLYARKSPTIDGLKAAPERLAADDSQVKPATVGAASIFYNNDGFYYLFAEDEAGESWEIWASRSASPVSGFVSCSTEPVLEGGNACPIILKSPDGSRAYLYTTVLSKGKWYARAYLNITADETASR